MKLSKIFYQTLAVTSVVASMFWSQQAQARVWFHYSTVEQNVMLQSWQLTQELDTYANKDLAIGELFEIIARIPYLNNVKVTREGEDIQTSVDLNIIGDYLKKYCPVDKENPVDLTRYGCANVLTMFNLRYLLGQNNLSQYYDIPYVKRTATAKKDQKTLALLKGVEVADFKDLYISQADINNLEIAKYLKQVYKVNLVPNPNVKLPEGATMPGVSKPAS
ncbi:hypothetical protein [Psittacicella gerlachiana]|uniref:Uncharacterized protein n=1 Tax=Psittacicella gerlachiana TaxID=2028574 RepID=A0A3A1YBB8_9GAMM|nr:hypothetical protein [Psittacicella gerlachiana]RIY34646.1 hypothetical protein CKF59_05190 [Psittacicella gerlachiana]